jgi:hypothetical protein
LSEEAARALIDAGSRAQAFHQRRSRSTGPRCRRSSSTEPLPHGPGWAGSGSRVCWSRKSMGPPFDSPPC